MFPSITASPTSEPFSPIELRHRPIIQQILAVAGAVGFLTLGSNIEVPMEPVSLTMQTFAIVTVAALYGFRLGTLSVLTWLAAAALGAPLLAGGAGGIQHFAGPTAGYLFAFPVMAAFVGWLAQRGWNAGQNILLAFLATALAHFGCLVAGTAWLSLSIGLEKAIIYGAEPFLFGAVLKSALAVLLMKALGSVFKQVDKSH